MDSLMEQYLNNMTLNLPKNDNLARSMALSSAIKKGQMLTNEEMRTIVDELFACKNPYTSPTGKKCFIKFDINELDNQFS